MTWFQRCFLVAFFACFVPAGACNRCPGGNCPAAGGSSTTGGTLATGGDNATGGALAPATTAPDAGDTEACDQCPKCLQGIAKAGPGKHFKLGLRKLYSVQSDTLGLEPTCTPKTTWWAPNDPDNDDQGPLGACTAFADVNCWSTFPFKGSGSVAARNAKAIDLYHWITLKDNPTIPGVYPPDDTGSTVNFAWLTGVDKGLWSSNAERASTGDGALCMLQRGPVMVGTDWLEGMFDFDLCGHASVTGPVAGGHAYLLLGYDTKRDLAWFDTSWGKVGVKDARGRWGYFSLTRAEFNRLMQSGGEAIRPSPLPE